MTMHRQMHQLPLAKTCCRLSSVAMSSGFVKQCHQTMEEGFGANDLNHAEDKCVQNDILRFPTQPCNRRHPFCVRGSRCIKINLLGNIWRGSSLLERCSRKSLMTGRMPQAKCSVGFDNTMGWSGSNILEGRGWRLRKTWQTCCNMAHASSPLQW